MGTITATVILDAVAKTLQDETNVKWSRLELLGYLNDGQREIVLAKPDAYVKNESLQLVAGAKQTIPATGNVFMRVNCNMGVNGTTPGRAPRLIPIRILDEQIPDWRASTPNIIALHYTFDDKDPKRFYVYPPQPATGMSQVEIVYSASPSEVTAEANPITLDDIWKTALMKYMEYRCYIKDAEYAREDMAGDRAYKVFAAIIGVKDKGDDEEKASR